MATLTAQNIDVTGPAITMTAAAGGGDSWMPTGDDRTFLWIKNGGGGSMTVTIVVPGQSFAAQNLADAAVTLSAGSERMIGPLTMDLAGNETFGFVVFSYSGVTSVTVAVVALPVPSASLPTA